MPQAGQKNITWSRTRKALCKQRGFIILQGLQYFKHNPLFSGLIFTTAQVVFTTVKIASIFMFLSAVHAYDFHIFTVSYSSLHGLFGTNIINSSQLACQLSWLSAAPVSLRSLVQISYRPEYFHALFSPLLTWWS